MTRPFGMNRTGWILFFATAGICGAIALSFPIFWLTLSKLEIGRSDFTSSYVGGLLMREGLRTSLYSQHLQSLLHHRLIAPDTEGNLPFDNPPTAALLALPLTFFPLDTAYRVDSLFQVACIVASVIVILSTLPSTREATYLKIFLVTTALAIPGTLAVLILGQWDGVCVLGIAVGYWFICRHQLMLGTFIFLTPTLATKPHLILGLMVVLLFWWRKQVIIGMVLSGAFVLLTSTALVGVHSMIAFTQLLLHSTTVWPLATFEGWSGLFGSWFGNRTPAYILTDIASAITICYAAFIGIRQHLSPRSRERFLAQALLLSCLVCPHFLEQDLTLLIPPYLWLVCAPFAPDHQLQHPEHVPDYPVMIWWGALIVGLTVDWGRLTPSFPGKITPLLLLTAVIASAFWRHQESPNEAIQLSDGQVAT